MDTVAMIPALRGQKERYKGELKSAKKKARSIKRAIQQLQIDLPELHTLLEDFEGQPGFNAVPKLRDQALADSLAGIGELAEHVMQMQPDARPDLLAHAESLLHADLPKRDYEYSTDEKKAMEGMGKLLSDHGFSGNSASKIIGTVRDTFGQLRKQWEASPGSHQATRRQLTRAKKG